MPIRSKTFHSTHLAHAKYDGEDLVIGFSNGGEYVYHGVPEDIWEGLTTASSVGSFFHHNIRNAGFDYEKLA